MVDRDDADALKKLYLAIPAAATEKFAIGYAPVNARFADPITVSPAANPVATNVPVEFDVAVVIVPSVVAPIVVVANNPVVMFAPLTPSSNVPIVARPVTDSAPITPVPIVAVPVDIVTLDPNVLTPAINGIEAVLIVAVLAERVPIVAVPVEIVTFDPNVLAPINNGIVAVLIVAVLIVAVLIVVLVIAAVLMLAVLIVAVPVDDVRFVPNVTGPLKRLLLETVNDPVLCTPDVETDRADETLFPSVIT